MDIQSHFMTMKKVIMSPKMFFDGLSATEGYKKVIVFSVINMILAFIVTIVFSVFLGGKNQTDGIGALLMGMVFFVPMVLVMLFIVAGILHVVAKILGGKGTYNGSFLVVGYSTALMPFSALPVIGMIVGLYQIYIEVIGFRKIHQYSTGRAVVTILLPLFILFGLIFVGVLVAGVAFLSVLQSGNFDPSALENLESAGSMQEVEEMMPQEVKDQLQMMEDTDTQYMYDEGAYPSGYEQYDDSVMMDDQVQQ